MKIPFIIYAQAYGIYLLLTIPAIVLPPMYFMSAMYAFSYGFAAMAIFVLLFLILHLVKPGYKTVIAILIAGVVLVVSAGYKLLLVYDMPETSFWNVNGYTLFPIAALLAGCIAVYINVPRIRNHLSPSIIQEVNTIGVQP